MEAVKKILVALDFSDYSMPTLRYGAALAEELGASLVAVNVLNERDVDAVRAAQRYTDQIDVNEYIEAQRKERYRRIAELLEQAHCGGISTEIIIRVGVPAMEILETVKETNADLVVIGTKGRTNISNMIFGSVAEKVFRRCPVSVLSARGESHRELVCKLDS